MKTKPFLLATAGSTVDGRNIDDKMIEEMASSYDPKTYGARLNIEHIRGISPDKPFNAKGDILELTVGEVDVNFNGKTEKRKALYGVFDVTEDAVAINKSGQKVYPSIEIEPNFAGNRSRCLGAFAHRRRHCPSARELKGMKDEARRLEKELAGVRKELSQGVASGAGNLSQLVQKERELTRAVAATNGQLQERGRRMARIQSIESKAGKVAGAAGIGGAAMTAGVTLPLMNFGQQSIQAFQESQDAIGQVEASLSSMGRQGEFTSAQLALMARGEMKKSLYDDDQILRDVTSNLLTFGAIGGDQFARAQAVAIDYSAKMKKDVGPSTTMVGKALNAPVKGLTMLGKAGIQFTDQQKAMVKQMVAAGDAAGAQSIILAELEKQFGGSAEAARKANPAAVAKQDLDDMQETVGGQLLPMMMKVTTAVGSIAQAFNSASPTTQKWIVGFGLFAAAAGPVLLGIAAIASGVGFLASGLAALTLPVIGVIAAIALLAYGAYTYWDQIKAAFLGGVAYIQGQWQYFKAGVTNLVTFFSTLPARLAMIGRNMIMGLVNGLKAAGGMVWSTLKNIVLGGINGVKAFLGIKSPSRVFMALGGYVSEGMAIGIDKGGRKAIGAAGRLATGVATAGALSLSPVAAAGPQGGSGEAGAAAAPYQITINVYGAQGQDVGALANEVARRIETMTGIRARSAYNDGD